MRILLTGKSGQLGFELARTLTGLGEVVAVNRSDCDLSDIDAVRALVRDVAPDVIINAAAYTAVDMAEAQPLPAYSINARLPEILGEEAESLGALVIHFSTDYVFDGTKAGCYAEEDLPSPCNVYGLSKLDGERALATATRRHLILRTSWVVGTHGGNFAKTIIRLARERDSLSIVADQFGAPTTTVLLADATAHLLRKYKREGSDTFPYGIYHVTPKGTTNWHAYACFVIEEARAHGLALKIKPADILSIASAQYPTPARRPRNSCLDTERFERTFEMLMPQWQESLRPVLREIFK